MDVVHPEQAPERRASSEFGTILRIGLPVAGTQFAFMAIGVVDTALLGHLDELSLAASAIGNIWNWGFLSLSLGLVLGADPFISQAFGRADHEGVALGLQRALLVALLASLPTCVAMLFTEPALLALGQPGDVARAAADYNLYKLPATPSFLCFVALRLYLQGRGKTVPALWVALFANVLNLFLGWALIFGRAGLPALGLTGAAIGAGLTSMSLPLLLVLWMRVTRLQQGNTRPWDARSFSPRGIAQILRMGVPISLQSAIEAWGFVVAMVMAGWMGKEELGSHQIGMNIAALAFMVPTGIAIGGSTRVGNHIGAKNPDGARASLRLALRLALSWSLIATPLLYFSRYAIGRTFSSDPQIIENVATLICFVALFQPLDAAHAVGAGVLRGMGRPNAAALMNFLGFAFGLPFAYFWGVHGGAGILAIWQALTLRLVFVTCGVVFWAQRTAKLPLEQLAVPNHA